ncbi:MAG TPA: hypothetical protein VK178_05265 [Opitutaceae bacterium]|nr:hypothetical protein [Opitutaceae bacterium]
MSFLSQPSVVPRLVFLWAMAVLPVPHALAETGSGAPPFAQLLPGEETAIPIPPHVTPADVDRVLAFVARHRKWSIDSRAPGRIELSLLHRGLDAHLVLTYDAQQLTVRSRTSTLDGRPVVPTRWITAFVKDVRYEFAAKNP